MVNDTVENWISRERRQNPKLVERIQTAVAHVDSIWEHIVRGEVRPDGSLVGFHKVSTVGGAHLRKIAGTEQVLRYGVYNAEVCRATVPVGGETAKGVQKKRSTFFPDIWSLETLKIVLVSAYVSKLETPTGGYLCTRRPFAGQLIEFKGDTAYPKGVALG
jgi:hypothetical protein